MFHASPGSVATARSVPEYLGPEDHEPVGIVAVDGYLDMSCHLATIRRRRKVAPT
jgi:hypothetical protein